MERVPAADAIVVQEATEAAEVVTETLVGMT